jgi:hypothetical protein
MGSFMSPKKPDTSAQEEATKQAKQDRNDAKQKNKARVRNSQNRARGRSLMAFRETGLGGVKDTLG